MKVLKRFFLMWLFLAPVFVFSQGTYTVTNTSDNASSPSTGSLRYCINQLNAASGGTIVFSISGSGPHTISLVAPLQLTKNINIDATSQSGWTSFHPQIILDGGNAINDAIEALGSGSLSWFEISGLQIKKCINYGIYADNCKLNYHNGGWASLINEVVITEINNGSSTTQTAGIYYQNCASVEIENSKIGSDVYNTPNIGIEDDGVRVNNSTESFFLDARITNCGVSGIHTVASTSNKDHYFLDVRITNCPLGIWRESGTNNDVPIPVITGFDATTNMLSGTGTAGDEIEIYETTGNENSYFINGTTMVQGNGQWSFLVNPADFNSSQPYCSKIATASRFSSGIPNSYHTNVTASTSQFSQAYAFNIGNCQCHYTGLTNQNPFVNLTSPVNYAATSLSTNLQASVTSTVPALVSVSTYSVHLMIAQEYTDPATGIAGPIWSIPITNTVTSTPSTITASSQILNTAISTYISSLPTLLTNYYWKVGIEYSPVVSGHHSISWSTTNKFSLSPASLTAPSAAYLTSGSHTDSINWVYGVSYLDNGTTSEGIAYIDGLGKSRQVQSMLNSQNTIMAVEAAYSEEGGGTVMSLPAPIKNATSGHFGYDHLFFDVVNSGIYHDISTEYFDRDVRQSDGSNLPMTPKEVVTSQGVGNYYSSSNSDAYIDDAGGYPYSFSVGYNNPLQRPMLTQGGVGSTFKIGGGKEYKHYYGKPDSQKELDRVYGVGSDKDKDKIARSITFDPNGVGHVTYKDNEGKVIATALASCSPTAVSDLTEDGVTGFTQDVNPLSNDVYDAANNTKTASSKFFLPCSTTVALDYELNAISFTYPSGPDGQTTICLACKYDVSLIVTNEATGAVVHTYTTAITPTDGCTLTDTYSHTASVTLNGPANYVVNRVIKPHLDGSGNTPVTNAVNTFLSYVNSNMSSYYTQYVNTVLTQEKYFVLRDEYVTTVNNNTTNTFVTTFNAAKYAGNGPTGSGAADAYPILGSTTYDAPKGISFDANGAMYVADYNNQSIRMINSNGIPTTITPSSSIHPYDVTFFSPGPDRGHGNCEGYLVVSDRAGNQIVKVNPTNGNVSTIMTGLNLPEGISESGNGIIYFTSSGDGKIYSYGHLCDVSLGSAPVQVCSGCSFTNPSDVEVDPNNPNIIYVSDRGTHQIYKADLSASSGAGAIIETYGSGTSGSSDNSSASSATFDTPVSLLYFNNYFSYTSPVLFVSDKAANNIRMIQLTGTNAVTTISGNGAAGEIDGNQSTSEFNEPTGMAANGNNIYLADKANNRIRVIYSSYINTTPCTTPCYINQPYPDEVNLINSQTKIVNLDGDPDGAGTTYHIGDEAYDITSIGTPTTVTLCPTCTSGTYYDFVTSYAQHNLMTIADVQASITSMEVYSSLSAPTTTNFGAPSIGMPALRQDHSLNYPSTYSLQPYKLLKVKISQPDCETQCTAVTDPPPDCSSQCNQQLQALIQDVDLAYNNMAASPLHQYYLNPAGATIISNVALTLQQLVNPFGATGGGYQSLPLWQYLHLTASDQLLYDDFELRLQALNQFNLTDCISLCNGTPPTSCDACKPVYSSCVMNNLDQLISGIEYIVQLWDPSTTTTQETFPLTVAQMMIHPTTGGADYPDPTILGNLGKPLFDYILNELTATGVTPHTAYNLLPLCKWDQSFSHFLPSPYNSCGTFGGTCSNCTSPSCSPSSDAPDLSHVPTFLIPVLVTANNDCDYEFNKCIALSTGGSTATNFLCTETFNNCIASFGPNPMLGSSDPIQIAWVANIAACTTAYSGNGTTTGCIHDVTTALATFNLYKHDIIFNALQALYPNPVQYPVATLETMTTAILTASHTATPAGVSDLDLIGTQNFMDNYAEHQECVQSCNDQLQGGFQTWLQNLINSTITQIQQNYYNNCIFSGESESLHLTYTGSFYHYTLYNYDYGNNLVSTVPPEGIDYVDLTLTTPPAPVHRMLTKYTNTSLYTTAVSSPDEGGTSSLSTKYYYDKVGRLRFSQSPEQYTRSTTSVKVYSYIKYDNESRVIETGEYQGSVLPSSAVAVQLAGWPSVGASTFEETYMYYDVPTLPANAPVAGYNQTYLEGRVARTKNADGAASHYSYDAHGRVKFVVQEFSGYGTGNNKYKTTDYTYLNLSSRVESITFQKWNAQEKFVHKYTYDSDYRLIKTEVSRNGSTYSDAANYEYYLHGPLKRTGLGNKAQDLDFVYNINGWLKAINDPTSIGGATNAANESTSSPTTNFGPDVFAEAINYFTNDYTRTGVHLDASSLSVPQSGTQWRSHANDLYNGNISSTVSLTAFDLTSALRTGTTSGSTQSISPVLVQAYKYDVLNRLTDVYGEELSRGYTASRTSSLTAGVDDIYKTAITYDANGNIKTLQRNSYYRYLSSIGAATTAMDDMEYKYDESLASSHKKHNQLQYVYDYAANTTNGEDIQKDNTGLSNSTQGGTPTAYTYTNTATHKYKYDDKGRVIYDYETNAAITWTVYDKIKSIDISGGNYIEFTYNPQQQRICKMVSDREDITTYEYYAYDANGILMATYTKTHSAATSTTTFKIDEFHMYGAGRLGTYRIEETISGSAPSNFADPTKQYFEITDHLGSVRAVVKGAKLTTGANSGNADIVSLTDYHEFGMAMQGRSFTGDSYKFGYQGSEKETGVKGMYTTDYRALDVRLGRWFTPDPVEHPWQTPYCSMDNNPIAMIDPMGADAGGGPGGGTQGEGGGGASQPSDCGPGGAGAGPITGSASSSGGDLVGSFSFANYSFPDHYTAEEVVITADKGNASKEWYDYISKVYSSGAYEELVNSLFNAKLDSYNDGIGKLAYGSTSYGTVDLPQGVIDRCRDEAEKEALPLLKDKWAREKSGWSGKWKFLNPYYIMYMDYRARTVTTKDEGWNLVKETGIAVVDAWSLRFSIGLKTIKPAMNTSEADIATGGVLGAIAKGGGEKYAFGFEDNAIALAKEIKGSHLMGVADYKTPFLKILSNPNSEIHFSLDGIDETVMEMIKTPGRSATNWEMEALYHSPAFERTIFHYGGKTYKGYEAFSIKP